ncbi:mechanosensitive ion channel domain-containing protein [Microbacterium sp. H1-D42]|uniref:mechanosensitive ion channel family protein n=1 Tax=Microbacterium sp. H1-D42 TaxID=2925844 RepID=UPI001F5306FB|nr:mechanosensitive ion channel domain-containing protein [Microbacterium sp. H1-D42]UNK72361.1 mechanosensitive ion channel family protein [Microbacterium sp. H1-D42]
MDLSALFPTGLTASQIVFAILAVIIGWIASRLVRSGILKLAKRTPGISDSVVQLAARFAQYLILLGGIGVALAFLGANVQPLLAMTLIAVLILVLVMRGVADNFAAGVLIQSRQSVKLGEQITVEGLDGVITGVVHELNGRSAIILTTDGRTVHVPHAMLMSGLLVNDSRHGARRSDLRLRIKRRDGIALDDVIERVVQAVLTAEGVHTREQPNVLLTGVSELRWMLTVQFWHHPLHGAGITSDVVRGVADALAEGDLVSVVTSEAVAPPLVTPDAV